jgi:hypothetical protein
MRCVGTPKGGRAELQGPSERDCNGRPTPSWAVSCPPNKQTNRLDLSQQQDDGYSGEGVDCVQMSCMFDLEADGFGLVDHTYTIRELL